MNNYKVGNKKEEKMSMIGYGDYVPGTNPFGSNICCPYCGSTDIIESSHYCNKCHRNW